MNPTQSRLDPRSSTYHQDLYKAGYISVDQLKAVESGSEQESKSADDGVLEWGMFISQHPMTWQQLDSINHLPKENAKSNSSESITPKFLADCEKRDKLLKEKYTKQGYTFAKNNGTNNNCLIISILQHATGKYSDDHDTIANNFRTKIDEELQKENSPTFKKHQALQADHVKFLIQEMKKDDSLKDLEFFKQNKSVTIWMANEKGEPTSFSIGDSKDKVIIFQGARHFEAVTPPAATSAQKTTAIANPAPLVKKITPSGSGNVNGVSNNTDNSELSFVQTEFDTNFDKFFGDKDENNMFQDTSNEEETKNPGGQNLSKEAKTTDPLDGFELDDQNNEFYDAPDQD